ncbi:hypothetical protein ABIE58_003180 [Roseovarius sp. MBR-78]|jgi:hypothetical protein|uniref:hypothetical protein n=1 Tax=Roseovarius sp. MBR-78 TaxID=3156460 RepID=UPI00339558B5
MKNDFKASEIENMSSDEKREFAASWFRTFHDDPVNEMPWVEGEYFYPYGGPYYASEVLYDHFDGILSDEEIERVVSELESDGVMEWAPAGNHPDQIQAYEDYVQSESEWLRKHSAVQEAENALLELSEMAYVNRHAEPDTLILRMIFVQCWSVLEGFSLNILKKHVFEEEAVRKRVVEEIPCIRNRKFSVKEIQDKIDPVQDAIFEHFETRSFHNSAIIKMFLQAAFGEFESAAIDIKTELATIRNLAPKRHDCVHRNGKTVEDAPTGVDYNDVESLIGASRSFVAKTGALVARELYKQEGVAQ